MDFRFLLDENVERTIGDFLSALGADVAKVPHGKPPLNDEEVLRLAMDQKRILVTRDRDFGRLIVRRGIPCPAIYLRFETQDHEAWFAALERLLAELGPALSRNFVTLTERLARLRRFGE